MAVKPEPYTLRVTESAAGYLIEVVELPGCVAVSKTLDGINYAIGVAIEVHLDALDPKSKQHRDHD